MKILFLAITSFCYACGSLPWSESGEESVATVSGTVVPAEKVLVIGSGHVPQLRVLSEAVGHHTRAIASLLTRTDNKKTLTELSGVVGSFHKIVVGTRKAVTEEVSKGSKASGSISDIMLGFENSTEVWLSNMGKFTPDSFASDKGVITPALTKALARIEDREAAEGIEKKLKEIQISLLDLRDERKMQDKAQKEYAEYEQKVFDESQLQKKQEEYNEYLQQARR